MEVHGVRVRHRIALLKYRHFTLNCTVYFKFHVNGNNFAFIYGSYAISFVSCMFSFTIPVTHLFRFVSD
jgi:hypothetical protein